MNAALHPGGMRGGGPSASGEARPQRGAMDLAAVGARQLVDDLELLGQLLSRRGRAARRKLASSASVSAAPGRSDDDGAGALAGARIGQREHGRLGHRRVAGDERLDLARR